MIARRRFAPLFLYVTVSCAAMAIAATGCASAEALMYVEDPAAMAALAADAEPAHETAGSERFWVADNSGATASDVVVRDEPLDTGARLPSPPLDGNVIYSADLKIGVKSTKRGQDAVIQETEALDGYLARAAGPQLLLRVPRENFHTLVERIRARGTVLDERSNAREVTRLVTDLELRIHNAEGARERVLQLMKREATTDDALRLQREERRVAGELEALRARLIEMKRASALASVTVRLVKKSAKKLPQAKRPGPHVVEKRSPFRFVRELAPEELLVRKMDVSLFDMPTGPWIDLPNGYFVVDRSAFTLSAITGDDARVFVRDVRVKGGDLTFWADVVEEEMVQNIGYILEDKRDVVRADGNPGRTFRLSTRPGKKPIVFSVTVYMEDLVVGPAVRVVHTVARPRAIARLDEVSAALAGPTIVNASTDATAAPIVAAPPASAASAKTETTLDGAPTKKEASQYVDAERAKADGRTTPALEVAQPAERR